MKKGKFIVIEGLDLTGKSTIINKLRERNPNYIYTREPGGKDIQISEDIRKILLENKEEIDPLTETYLFAASRAAHTKKIKEWIDKGQTVVCDRYVYSNLYYQGIMKKIGIPTILDINNSIFQNININIDKVFFITASKEERIKRAKSRKEINLKDIESIKNGQEECYRQVLFDVDYMEIDTTDNNLDRSIVEIEKEIERIGE